MTGIASSERMTRARGRWPRRPPARPDVVTRLLTDRKYPHDPALRDVLVPPEEVAEQALLERRVDAPAGGHPDVLHAIDRERDGRCGDAGVRAELPQHLAGARIEGPEVAVIRPAAEHESARGRQHRPPVHRVGEEVTPDALVAVHVPRLHFTEVPGAL